jgi:hypothetical protein
MANGVGEGHQYILPIVEGLVGDTGSSLEARIQREFPKNGEAIPSGLIEGARNGNPLAIAMVKTLAEDLGLCFKDVMDINSPSGVFMDYGRGIVQGLCRGLKALKSQPVTNLQTLATSMQRVYNTTTHDYITIGRDIMTGLNQGLLNGESALMSTANRIANNITRTMRNALDINSPSRVMREQIGRQIPAGVAAGIEKYTDYAINSVHDLGKELIKINFPSMNDIINIGPSLSLAGATGGNMTTNDHGVVINNKGMFDGANLQLIMS